jgi:phosphoglycolate phosphatase
VTSSLVVFDLDGTLVDSLPDIAAALNHALASCGLGGLPLDVVRSLVGDGVEVLARRALTRQSAERTHDASAIARAIQRRYLEVPCVESRLYTGISEVLTRLAQDPGRRLAVLTNKPGDVARGLLEALGVATRFDAVIGDGDGHPRKPDPAALRSLASRLGASLSRTLVVGDGLPDLAVARAAPCASAAALWGYTPAAALRAESPTHELARPLDLLAVV